MKSQNHQKWVPCGTGAHRAPCGFNISFWAQVSLGRKNYRGPWPQYPNSEQCILFVRSWWSSWWFRPLVCKASGHDYPRGAKWELQRASRGLAVAIATRQASLKVPCLGNLYFRCTNCVILSPRDMIKQIAEGRTIGKRKEATGKARVDQRRRVKKEATEGASSSDRGRFSCPHAWNGRTFGTSFQQLSTECWSQAAGLKLLVSA